MNGIGFMMRYKNIQYIEYYSHSPSPFFWALYIIRSVLEKGSPGRGQLVHPFPSSNVASFSLTHEPWSWAAKKSRPFTLTSPFFFFLTLCLFLELRFTITYMVRIPKSALEKTVYADKLVNTIWRNKWLNFFKILSAFRICTILKAVISNKVDVPL